MYRILLVLSAVLAATACVSTRASHGYIMERGEETLTAEVGIDTKDSVLARYGEPSVVPVLNDNTWYYISSATNARAYYKTQTQARSVVAFNFDVEGTVTEVSTFNLEDGMNIALTERETPTKGKELSILEQLVGNVGQVATVGEEGGGPGGP